MAITDAQQDVMIILAQGVKAAMHLAKVYDAGSDASRTEHNP